MSTYKSRKNAIARFGVSHKRLMATSALTAVGLMGLASPAQAVDDYAVWSVGHYEGGTSASITGSGQGYVQYTANTDRVIAVLDQKHIGKLGHVDINAALWVAKGQGADPMQILGKLTSTGQLLVIDGNGVFFGPGSRVDAAGLIATTGDISNAQILNNNFGDYEINGATSGAIENHGMINVTEAGLAAFVAPSIRNSGVINAKLGKVAFASGEKVTLDLYGDGLFEVAVEGELSDALIENIGSINAEGGSVNMTAAAAKNAVDNIINVSGVVTVASATQQGGKIVLSGGSKGKVTVSGKLDASGTNGGKIDVKGQNIDVADTAVLKADGGQGADGAGNAGQVLAIAEDHMDFRGSIYARGGANGGNGGFSEVSGYGTLGFDGFADLSAANGETGTLLLDPTFAVIHSGIVNNPLGFNYILSARALANSLRFSNVTVQADNFIDVGTRVGGYNTGNILLDLALNTLTGSGSINVSTWQTLFNSGITNNNLTLDSTVVNFNKDLTMGNGSLFVDADTINLNSTIYGYTGGVYSGLLSDPRLASSATVLNVLSNAARIQQGLDLIDSNGTVNVAAGTYVGALRLSENNVTLVGAPGAIVQADAAGDLVTVTGDNVTIDPFVFDGMGIANNGINANTAHNLVVDGNTFQNFLQNGISVQNSNNIQILNNTINNVGWDGVILSNVSTGLVDGNTIDNVSTDLGIYHAAIRSNGSSNITISNNDIGLSGNGADWGIGLLQSNNINVTGNEIYGVRDGVIGYFINGLLIDNNIIDHNRVSDAPSGGGYGIYIDNSHNLQIGEGAGVGTNGNIIDDFVSGIEVHTITGTTIIDANDITDVHRGITATNVAGLRIVDNEIDGRTGPGRAPWHGIRVENSNGAVIGAVSDGNIVRDFIGNGVEVINSDNASIAYNQISDVTSDGIFVDDSFNADIRNNTIYNTGDDAIEILNSSNATVSENVIGYTDAAGTVLGAVNNVAGVGIRIDNGAAALVRANKIVQTGGWGAIEVVNTNGATIGGAALVDANVIRNSAADGVRMENSSNITVQNNDIDTTGRVGIWGGNVNTANILSNIVKNDLLGGYGSIHADGGSTWNVSGNDIDNGDYGILLNGTTGTNLISNNQVDGMILSGIRGQNVSNLTVSGNTIGLSGVGAITGIQLFDGANTRVVNNNVYGVINGITANGVNGLWIDDNTLDHNLPVNDPAGGNYGIYVVNSNNVQVGEGVIVGNTGNNIDDFGTAIFLQNNTGTTIVDANDITDADWGIYASNVAGLSIVDSQIDGRTAAGRGTGSGIFVENSNGAVIGAASNDTNIIRDFQGHGVQLINSDNALISYNTISGVSQNGVYVDTSDNATVANNTINADANGVLVISGSDHDVQFNTINGGVRGILLSGTANNNNVVNNFIGQTTGTAWNSIEIFGNTGSTNVSNNDIDNAGWDGINVSSGTGFVTVQGNDIDNTTGASGIAFVFHNGDGLINNNSIDGADRLGIYIGRTDNLTISNNTIRNTGREAGWFTSGIHLEDADNTTVTGNTINTVNNGGDGIRIGGAGNWAAVATTGNVISNNIIYGTSDDGVEATDSAGVQITGNAIGWTNLAGTVAGAVNNIGGEGVDVNNSPGANISNNKITRTVSNGISINPSPNSVIQGNNILNVGGHGVLVNAGSHNSDVLDNIISGAGLDGIRAEGSNNLEILRNQVRAIGTTVAGALGYGIYVNGGTLALIEDNQILGGNGASGVAGRKGAGLDAIHVDNNDGVRIIDNTVRGGNGQSGLGNAGGVGGSGAGGHGIYITQSSGALVSENDVLSGNNNGLFPVKNGGRGADLGGIYAINNAGINAFRDGIQIVSNVINNANAALSPADVVNDDGIYVQNSGHFTTGAKARIHDNTVSNVGEDGIDVRSTNGVIITSNRIDDAEEMGIKVDASNSALVQLNTIGTGAALNRGAGIDGIHVTNSRNISIDQNTVQGGSGSSGAGRDGIRVLDSREASITNNTIRANGLFSVGAVNDGIHVDNSGAIIGGGFDAIVGQFRDGVVITGNQILSSGLSLGAGNHGIFVNNSAGGLFATPPATISLNTVRGVGNDGIHVQSTNGAQITSNTITAAGNNGIYVNPSSFVTVANNIINLVGAHGIYMLGGAFNSILNNTISLVGIDGVHVRDVLDITITGNSVTGAGDDGIDVANSGPATINNNTVIGVVDNGIILTASALANVNGNTVTGAGTDGINVSNVLDLNVNNNIITGVGDDGIDVSTSAPANINSNSITGALDNGIILTGSVAANVNNNTILGVGTDGINVSNVLGLTIDGNSVTGAGDDGIDVSTSAPTNITNNVVTGVVDNGIDVNGVIGYNISGNAVALSGDNGIELSNAALGLVGGNLIGLSGGDGINGQNLAATLIAGNLVGLSGDDGIDVGNGIGVGIVGNAVLGALDNGIEVDNVVGALIAGNAVVGTGNNGIQLTDALLASINNNVTTLTGNNGIRVDRAIGLNVSDNLVTLAGDDGIDADNIVFANISGNTVAGVLSNGIEVGNASLVNISDNNVVFTGNDGIHVENSALVGVRNNNVAFNIGDGIDVEDSFGVAITGNTVRFAGDNGIELQNSDTVLIDNNNVRFVGDNGIYVNPSNNVTISNNTINDTLDDGIDVNGGNAITITNNLIGTLSGNIGDDGIDVNGSSDVTISNNQITDAADAGIELRNTNGVEILFNDIYENGNYGLWARGAGNGSIVLAGNTFTDNRTGARFESGAIDLTDLANPNRFIFTPGFLSDAANPAVGMQFDLAPGALATDLTIVDNTLGATIFEGFLARPVGESYYVRFEDGAILDAGGGVITIDGTLASWDGIVPATFPGLILPLATLNAIEDRLFDADDAALNGRGQIFVGFPPLLGLDNVEDFFNRFAGFGAGPSGLNLTITGLPRVTPGALNLGAITPFAGDEAAGLAGIEPAAGDESGASQAIQDIEPASGGNDAACWGDALNAAVNGAVNYNFTGDMQEMMNDASACGTVVGAL